MNRWATIATVSMMMAALTACDVHQFPYDEEKEPLRVILDLDYSTQMPIYTIIDYPDGTAQSVSSRAEMQYQIRHTVEVFSTDGGTARAAMSRAKAEYSTTVYRPMSDGLDTQIEIQVPDGPYMAMVWTDYVPIKTSVQPFYDVSDFADIHYTDLTDYIGSTDMRDAFRGEAEFVIPDYDLVADNIETIPVTMTRPLGKYMIIATDVRQFISRALSRGGINPESVSDSRAFDFTKYKVRVVYTGYVPTAFNMFLNKPVDSALGLSYFSEINLISDDEAMLAFDYVMVNGSETKIDAVIQIVDEDLNVLAQSSSMRIPVVRSKYTEVRGKFLTASSSSGIGIITEFDGEYNIEIR